MTTERSARFAYICSVWVRNVTLFVQDFSQQLPWTVLCLFVNFSIFFWGWPCKTMCEDVFAFLGFHIKKEKEKENLFLEIEMSYSFSFRESCLDWWITTSSIVSLPWDWCRVWRCTSLAGASFRLSRALEELRTTRPPAVVLKCSSPCRSEGVIICEMKRGRTRGNCSGDWFSESRAYTGVRSIGVPSCSDFLFDSARPYLQGAVNPVRSDENQT